MSAKLMGTNNPNLKTIFPHHHRVQAPAGQASLADFQAAMAQVGAPAIQITETVRSQVYPLTK